MASVPNAPLTAAHRNLSAAFDYLLHLNGLRTKPVFRLEEHGPHIYHETAFQDLPGVEINPAVAGGEVWLRLRRLHAHKPPEPAEPLNPWVTLVNDPAKRPVLQSTLVMTLGIGPTAETVEWRLEDHPDIEPAFAAYLHDAWEPWAAEEVPRRAAIRLYDKLFELHQDAEGATGAEDTEVAWGVGVAVWKHPGAVITYPLFTKTVELRIDPATMALEVAPTERETQLHIDAFTKLDVPAEEVEARAKREAQQSEVTFSPFDPGTYEGVLRFAASYLDSHGQYWPESAPDRADRTLPKPSEHLVVTDTWVLFARKRGTSFMVADIRKLKELADRGVELTGAAAVMVTTPPDEVVRRDPRAYRGISNPGGGAGGTAQDLYFPKPFNAEQVTIVERLEQADGVVVQGPPGTGKTHTIANLICHALACGQRVLVTAQHEAPLAVLRDQLPEPLRPLAISLLTSEREGLRQLEQSVREIASGTAQRHQTELEAQVAASRARLDSLHQHIAALDHALRDWGQQQTSEVPFLGDGTRPAQLAARMIADQARFSWFPDTLPADAPPAPVDEAQIAALREARQTLGADLRYLGVDFPDPARLPDVAAFVDLHRQLVRAGELQQRATAGLPALRDTRPDTLDAAQRLREQARQAQAVLRAYGEDWHRQARALLAAPPAAAEPVLRATREDIPEAPADPFAHALRDWTDAARALGARRAALVAQALELPPGSEGYAPLETAVGRAAQGLRPFGWFGADKPAKVAFEQIRLAGRSPETAADWQIVQDYLMFARDARQLRAQWNSWCAEFGAEPLPEPAETLLPGLALAKHLEAQATPLAALRALDDTLRPALAQGVDAVFAGGFDTVTLTQTVAALARLVETLDVHLEQAGLAATVEARRALRALLEPAGGELGAQLRGCFHQLGFATTDTEELARQWGDALATLHRLTRGQALLARVETLTAAIAAGGAPRWAQALREPPAEEDSWLPPDWRAAWEWARSVAYLTAIDGREELQRLSRERREAEGALARETLALVEALTWQRLKENLTRKTSAALQAYLSAITKIGLGTGIRAARHRETARQAMRDAHAAVPCWIMPHWRVSETLPAEFGLFDLVIIDEASQSDAWALPALARARKVVVVGDDKQVSPSDVGMAEADLRALKQRFLTGLPHGDHLLPGGSIYDLASTAFATDLVRLREHFRCVEPIIAFCNKTFYNHEIKPLRVPKPSERLDPPLIDVFVKGGYRDGPGQKLNPPEARYIVEAIRAITQDPRMAERSLGVVSLLGAEQAHHIQALLVSELGEEIILRHNIRCGDAMSFQGKEADIVFVSMVAAGSLVAQTGRTWEQRYNVAISRARDRLYVVRSFTRGEVKDTDLRARLLDHLEHPLLETPRELENLRALCESPFESEVFDALVARGYRVTPQVPVGGYRLDLVVEGADDRRLAVECDGDRYHGVERWMADITRQRALERMGWRFWRCWGSSWTAQREACLADLFATLAEAGIEPLGQSDAVPGRYVEQILVEPPAVPAAAVAD